MCAVQTATPIPINAATQIEIICSASTVVSRKHHSPLGALYVYTAENTATPRHFPLRRLRPQIDSHSRMRDRRDGLEDERSLTRTSCPRHMPHVFPGALPPLFSSSPRTRPPPRCTSSNSCAMPGPERPPPTLHAARPVPSATFLAPFGIGVLFKKSRGRGAGQGARVYVPGGGLLEGICEGRALEETCAEHTHI
ncbi:hypothetical protein B0H11DRAFT_1951407 [Mycena galericulata]|nr:hypothetical protein B0H11DRAFT_1951407 [Mycena galericulata]